MVKLRSNRSRILKIIDVLWVCLFQLFFRRACNATKLWTTHKKPLKSGEGWAHFLLSSSGIQRKESSPKTRSQSALERLSADLGERKTMPNAVRLYTQGTSVYASTHTILLQEDGGGRVHDSSAGSALGYSSSRARSFEPLLEKSAGTDSISTHCNNFTMRRVRQREAQRLPRTLARWL